MHTLDDLSDLIQDDLLIFCYGDQEPDLNGVCRIVRERIDEFKALWNLDFST